MSDELGVRLSGFRNVELLPGVVCILRTDEET